MKNLLVALFVMLSLTIQAQTGHVLQGAGAVNFSMGGAATALPINVNGALQWNPASITAFDHNELDVSLALFTAAPQVYAKAPTEQGGFIEGTTEDERGVSPLPTVGAVFANEDSPFAFGISAFGISGFGVDYPAEASLPVPENQNFDPTNSNPLLYPQNFGGFGHLFSGYQLLQAGVTGAYEVTDGLSLGIAPTFNYASLEIEPVPIAAPDQNKGYPVGERATATGFGFQAGVFYQTEMGLNFGLAYKSTQWFNDLEIDGEYLDGSTAPVTNFNLDYPSMISAGIGYTSEMVDVALDYRYIDYENTDGFAETGWVIADNGFPTGAVAGFGWESIHVIAVGVQYKGIEKLPLRVGYTYNTNPITEDNIFFSASAPAVLENAAQIGFTYEASENIGISLTYHRGMTTDVSGQLLNPTPTQFGGPWSAENPLGKVPGSEMKSEMHTDVLLIGVTYGFGK